MHCKMEPTDSFLQWRRDRGDGFMVHLWGRRDCTPGGGGTSRKKWGGGGWCAARFLKPLPYFRPKSVIFPFPYFRPDAEAVYGTYTVGLNIKREMVVIAYNDEEVASSKKKIPNSRTRVHKPYPIWDQNDQNWYPISGWLLTTAACKAKT